MSGNTTGNGPKLTPGAILTELPRFVLDQAMGALKTGFGFGRQQERTQAEPVPSGATPQLTDPNLPHSASVNAELQRINDLGPKVRREPWFGPSTPMRGQAPRGDVAGRARDYPVGINLSMTPRQYESMNFGMIRGLFEGLDLAKLCVETRKNQMAKLSWEIMPRMKPGENVRVKDDPRCAQLEAFFRSPDRKHNWDQWMRMILDEMLVTDATSLYVRRTVGGDIYSIEAIQGDTIIPRLDKLGRTPEPPEDAFTQILKGIPAVGYTTDELIYFPRNLRAGRVYGYSPIENIGMTIQIAIRREISKLSFWTSGNIPDAFIGTPSDWTPDQIDRMQQVFDNWTSDPDNRRKAYFIPGGANNYNPLRPVQTLDPQQDEWLARVICYSYGLPCLPLVQQQNRATAESADDAALREGLAPCIVWLKGLMDHIIQKIFGFPDIEWIMDSYQEEDPTELSTRQIAEVKAGLLSMDEYRAERGLPGYGLPAIVFGIGPAGFMAVSDIKRAIEQGATGLPMPGAMDAAAGAGLPFDPSGAPQGGQQLALPSPGQPLALPAPANDWSSLKGKPGVSAIGNHNMADLPPELLNAVGLKPDHKKIARPVGKPNKAGPGIVLANLAHHEARLKTPQNGASR
jgi:hypothetical protein